jgi:uncharacterized protein YbbK (DUF523 family)
MLERQLGIVTSARVLQPLKAASEMLVVPSGITVCPSMKLNLGIPRPQLQLPTAWMV